jgi:hypothetical protein
VPQFKVFAQAPPLLPVRGQMVEVLRRAAARALAMPPDSMIVRLFPMAAEDFPTPVGRSSRYTVIEVHLLGGRSAQTKRSLLDALHQGFEDDLAIASVDLEVLLLESAPHDWAVRGRTFGPPATSPEE